MLLLQDPLGKRFLRISLKNRDFSLNQDRPGVRALVHVMDRAAGFGVPREERPPLGVETGILREQRRVNVEDARPP